MQGSRFQFFNDSTSKAATLSYTIVHTNARLPVPRNTGSVGDSAAAAAATGSAASDTAAPLAPASSAGHALRPAPLEDLFVQLSQATLRKMRTDLQRRGFSQISWPRDLVFDTAQCNKLSDWLCGNTDASQLNRIFNGEPPPGPGRNRINTGDNTR